MHAFYCESCDGVIIHAGRADDKIPTEHKHTSERWFPITYMGWFHPDHKVCEVEGTIRHQIETFGTIEYEFLSSL
jgi:hypothetical protein